MRKRGFSIPIMLTLILGVAGVVGVLAIWRQALNPYGVPDGGRILLLKSENKAQHYFMAPECEVYDAWRQDLRSFEQLGAFDVEDATIRRAEESRVLKVALVDGGLVRLLGIRPEIGRLFDLEEPADRQSTLLVSRGLARAMFAAPEAAVGEVLTVNGIPRTVLGVLPAHFEDAFSSLQRVDLVMALEPAQAEVVQVLGKLGAKVSLQQAQAELAGWGSLQSDEFTRNGELSWTAWSPLKRLPTQTLLFLKIALGGCLLFLMVTLSNVLHLIAVQVEKERRDTAIRWVLGEGRRHLVRRKLNQALLLTLIPGAGATLLALGGLRIFQVTLPESLRFLAGATIGRLEFAFALALCMVIVLVFGSVPRLLRRTASLLHDLRTELRFGRPSFFGKLLGQGHILTMLATALVLVVGAYLVLGSLLGLSRLDLGLDPRGVQVVEVELPGWKYEADEKRGAFFEGFEERLRALPGLAEGALASAAPPANGVVFGTLKPSTGEPHGTIPSAVGWVGVRPGYFRTLRQEFVAGQDFEATDMAAGSPAVVLSETLARYLFGTPQGAVGQRADFDGEVLEVRGVVQDVRTEGMYRSFGGVQMYVPLNRYFRSATVVLRTDSVMGDTARNLALKMDPDVVVAVASMESRVADSLTGIRFFATLFGLLTALAIGLAAVGVYGVLNHFARRHQAQVALRIALGATPDSVLRWLLTRGLVLGVLGSGLGVVLSYPFANLLQGQLFGLEAGSLTARVVAVALVLVATFLATWLPARRASRVDPVEFLRES